MICVVQRITAGNIDALVPGTIIYNRTISAGYDLRTIPYEIIRVDGCDLCASGNVDAEIMRSYHLRPLIVIHKKDQLMKRYRDLIVECWYM